MHTFALLFFLKPEKKRSDGRCPVYLKITVDGKKAELSTKVLCAPGRWSQERQKVKDGSDSSIVDNQTLANVEKKVRKIYNFLDEEATAAKIKQIYVGGKPIQHQFLATLRQYNATFQAREGKTVSKRTVKRILSHYKIIEQFIKDKYNQPDLLLTDVKKGIIDELRIFLIGEKKFVDSTIVKYLTYLKSGMNYALDCGYISYNCLTTVKIGRAPEKDIIALSEEEIEKLAEHRFASDFLQRMADVFIFSVATGLAYSEMLSLTSENIGKGLDGHDWLYVLRGKTSRIKPRKVAIPLLAKAKEIINKYKNDEECLSKGRLLPVATNQIYNRTLKEIGAIIGLNFPLTTHTGRRSAAMYWANNGIPIEIVSKLLGHSDISTTQKHYARIREKTVGEALRNLEKRKQSGE